jgi:hypothetical protein
MTFLFALAFLGLEDIFNIVLQDHQVRSAFAINLQRVTIVPLDGAFDLFSITKHNNHQRVSIDLLLVIEEFGVRLEGRWHALPRLRSGLWGRRRWRCRFPGNMIAASAALDDYVRSFLRKGALAMLSFNFCQGSSNQFTIHVGYSTSKIQEELMCWVACACRTISVSGQTSTVASVPLVAALVWSYFFNPKWNSYWGILIHATRRKLKTQNQNRKAESVSLSVTLSARYRPRVRSISKTQSAFFRINVGTSRSSARDEDIDDRGRSSIIRC